MSVVANDFNQQDTNLGFVPLCSRKAASRYPKSHVNLKRSRREQEEIVEFGRTGTCDKMAGF